MIIIKDVSIFDGNSIKKNKNVYLSKNKIVDIKNNISHSGVEKSVEIIEGKGNFLIPGFIDVQINGGGGFLLNREPTAQALKKIFYSHLKYGTTSFFPTFISDTLSRLKKCVLVVENAQNDKESGIVGFHIEGPFLNKMKKGIHAERNVIPFSTEWLNVISKIKVPHVMITLAPEIIEPGIIEKLVKKKIHVFAGHTNASAEEMKKAFTSGVSGVTHLFNACSQISARDVGVVGASLLKKNILCSVIVDGKHVSYDALKIALKVKEPKHFVLVSDSMESVGTDLKEFNMFGEKIYVEQNTLKNEAGTLAGSHLTMLWAFQNTIRKKLVSFEDAIRMSSTNQAEFFKLKNKGVVVPGYDANLLMIDKNNLELLNVIFFGKNFVHKN